MKSGMKLSSRSGIDRPASSSIHVNTLHRPVRLAVTPGEPAGIGTDICILSSRDIPDHIEPVFFTDPELLMERAEMLGIGITLNDYGKNRHFVPEALNIVPVHAPVSCRPGKPDPENAEYVLECLEQALAQCLDDRLAALVTGPVNKGVINEAGIAFSGHTEWLARQTGTGKVVMLLASRKLKVALATTHLPLRSVPDAINREDLKATIEIVRTGLQDRFGIAHPRITVCGLNPHAGEGGHLGTEEQDTILPVIEELTAEGFDLVGPLPADTAFTPDQLERTDAVLAMYHDQGLPVLKHQGFGGAVNITLGLPIIRTSVDHGTALDIAGTGKADTGSFMEAMACAAAMAIGKVT